MEDKDPQKGIDTGLQGGSLETSGCRANRHPDRSILHPQQADILYDDDKSPPSCRRAYH
jgi:hypothetical protein